MCREKGADEVVAVDINPERLEIANRFGATKLLLPDAPALRQRAADVVIDYSGRVASMEAGVELLNIELPFKVITPGTGDKTNFITYLQQQINALRPDYGTFPKMIMSRGTFVKNIIGSAEFGDKFKMQLSGNAFRQ